MAATKEQLEKALHNAHKAGDTVAARRIAGQLKNIMEATETVAAADPEQMSGGGRRPRGGSDVTREGGSGEMQNVRNFAGGFNKRLIDMVGGAADVVNAPLRAMGVPGMGQAGDVQRNMANAAESIGINIPQESQGMAGKIGEVGAEAMTAFLPMAKGVQGLSKAKGTAGRVGREMLDQFISPSARKQAANLATEASAVAGAGAARDIAQDASGTGQMYAELAGGLVGAAAPGVATASLGRRAVGGVVNRIMRPWTEAGAIENASKIMQDWALNPPKAAAAILDTKGTNLRPSAMSADKGLMALEATVLNDPMMVGLASSMDDEAQAVMYQLVDSIKQSGNARSPRAFLEAKVKRLSNALDANTAKAEAKAVQALQAIDPESPASDISAVLRKELETSLADAKVQEAMLWQAIPQEAPTPNSATKRAFKEALDSLSAAQAEDMPPIATKVIAGMDMDEVPLMEMDGLYKKLGEVQRQAKAAGEWNRARIAGDLRNAALADMGNARGPEEVQHSIKLARAFSRKLQETFNRGAVGKILRNAADGGDRLDPTLALEKTVGMGGQQGKLAADEVSRAKMIGAGRADEAMTFTGSAEGFVGENVKAMQSVQDFIKADFMQRAVVDGRVDPAKAATALKRHAEVLDAFPHLREQLSAARSAADVLRRVTKRNDAWRKAMDRPSVSTTAKFLNGPVDKEIGTIMDSKDPARVTGELVKSMRKSPEAMDGLRAGMAEWLIKQGTRNEQLDSMGRLPVNGPSLALRLKDSGTRAAFEQVFSKEQMAQIEKNIDLLSRLTLQRQAKAGKQISPSQAPWLIQKFARMIGARFGAKLAGTTGGSIQMAQMGATEAEKLTNRLVGNPIQEVMIDALFGDGELMAKLLTRLPKESSFSIREMGQREMAEMLKDKTLRAYYYSRWAPLLEDEESQASPAK